jgi:hypothetical protein
MAEYTPIAACQRCHTLAVCQPLGALLVCSTCCARGFALTCPPGMHDYRGWGQGWLCLRCGFTLMSQGITESPPAAPAPVNNWDC